MRKIEVVAAILQQDERYFATQRGYGAMEGMWEFPGGKIEPGESPEAALHRELQEELGVAIVIDEHLSTTDYDYPAFHLTLRCYLCRIAAGEIELREHKSARWLLTEELDEVAWLPADKEVIELLKKRKAERV